MKTSTRGLLALINHEGVVLSSYRDSVGVWTIGVGHTAGAGTPYPLVGMTITLEQAVDIFRNDIVKFENGVNRAVKVPLKQHQFDALVSFHFNTGGIARARLTKSLNAGDMDSAASQFMGWKKPKSIIGRRKKEQALFATGDYGNIETAQVYDTLPGKARAVSTAAILGSGETPEPTTPTEKPKGNCMFDFLSNLLNQFTAPRSTGSGQSWLGRLLVAGSVGEASGQIDFASIDLTGQPGWVMAAIGVYWLVSEKQDSVKRGEPAPEADG